MTFKVFCRKPKSKKEWKEMEQQSQMMYEDFMNLIKTEYDLSLHTV